MSTDSLPLPAFRPKLLRSLIAMAGGDEPDGSMSYARLWGLVDNGGITGLGRLVVRTLAQLARVPADWQTFVCDGLMRRPVRAFVVGSAPTDGDLRVVQGLAIGLAAMRPSARIELLGEAFHEQRLATGGES